MDSWKIKIFRTHEHRPTVPTLGQRQGEYTPSQTHRLTPRGFSHRISELPAQLVTEDPRGNLELYDQLTAAHFASTLEQVSNSGIRYLPHIEDFPAVA